jgi:hypothetical protein
MKKVNDYQISDFNQLMDARMQSLPEFINDGKFSNEMCRFLPRDVFDRTLATDKFRVYLTNTLVKLHGKLGAELFGAEPKEEFKMQYTHIRQNSFTKGYSASRNRV